MTCDFWAIDGIVRDESASWIQGDRAGQSIIGVQQIENHQSWCLDRGSVSTGSKPMRLHLDQLKVWLYQLIFMQHWVCQIPYQLLQKVGVFGQSNPW